MKETLLNNVYLENNNYVTVLFWTSFFFWASYCYEKQLCALAICLFIVIASLQFWKAKMTQRTIWIKNNPPKKKTLQINYFVFLLFCFCFVFFLLLTKDTFVVVDSLNFSLSVEQLKLSLETVAILIIKACLNSHLIIT